MSARLASSRLAARAHARQVEAVLRADRAADAADRAIAGVWRQLLQLLRQPGHWADAQRRVTFLLRGLLPAVRQATAGALVRQARWGWRSAVADVLATVPAKLLARAAAPILAEGRHANRIDRHGRGVGDEGRRTEAPADDPGGIKPLDEGVLRGQGDLVQLAEADEGLFPAEFRFVDVLGTLGLSPQAQAGTLRSGPQPATPAGRLSSLLFPAPSDDLIAHVVFASGWEERLQSLSRLAPPERLASAVASGLAQGRTRQEIARDLMPLVNQVRASARRVARTEGLRVAGAAQLACHERLGPLVAGYVLHATLDEHTRPWHAARNGRAYYAAPKPHQDGYDKMPRPPDEPPDPAERPPKAPATAPN